MILLTAEGISLNKKYAGIAKVRVSQACKGILVSTSPLKPGYSGRLTIAMHNSTDADIEIGINEGIVVIMLFKLDNTATTFLGNGCDSKQALISILGFEIDDSLHNEIFSSAYTDASEIRKSMCHDSDYKEYMKIQFNFNFLKKPAILLVASAITYFVIKYDVSELLKDLILIPLWTCVSNIIFEKD